MYCVTRNIANTQLLLQIVVTQKSAELDTRGSAINNLIFKLASVVTRFKFPEIQEKTFIKSLKQVAVVHIKTF